MTYHFPVRLADLQKTYENFTTNLGKILQKSYEVSKIGPLDLIGNEHDDKT